MQEKERQGKLSGTARDLIEAIVRNSVEERSPVYTDQSIFDEFKTFFLAGVDMTSSFLAMMIYLIAQHPEVEGRVREEISRVKSFSHEELKQLTYLECVQKEVTRFYGPGIGNFPRLSLEDHHLKGVPIRKGTMVHNQPLGLHHSEEYYRDASAFRPERWLGECDSLPAYALVSFSGGPRTCIGKHLALLESKVGLIKFMRRYRSIEAPRKIELILRSTYQPKGFSTRLVRS